MRVFLAGASGVIGRSLIGLLLGAGHEVTGMTRPAARAEEIRARGAQAAVADALDAQALREAVVAARPEGVIHQLTALPPRIHPRRYGEALAPTNVLRRERTRDLETQVLEHGTSGSTTSSMTSLLRLAIGCLYTRRRLEQNRRDPFRRGSPSWSVDRRASRS
jgi:uncharacterized protein YbjT (DUF2867 family)